MSVDRAERRRRVRSLLAEDLPVREVARRLGVSPQTVMRDRDAEAPTSSVAPAPNGNLRAMTHGLTSSRIGPVVEARARELSPGIVAAHPHLDQQRDGQAVFRYALVLARLERAYGWLAEQGDELFADLETGLVHGLYGRIGVWEKQASRDEERLAISPRERTRLKLDQVRRGLLLGGDQRVDFSRLDDDELDEYQRLAAKAAAIDGEATP